MNTSFLILSGVTALSVLAAAGTYLTGEDAPALAASGERVFPELEGEMGDIARVTIREDGDEMVLERREGRFVDAASGYPIAQETLRELVGAIALAQIAEARTTDPSRHDDLDLAAPDAAEGAGTEIVLSDAEGDPLAHVIAGARDYTLGGVTGGQYLRRGGEDATWLARARIDTPASRSRWFDNALFETEADQVTAMTLTPQDAAELRLVREEGVLRIATALPEGRSAKQDAIDRLARLVTSLDFEDVRATRQGATEGARLSADLADGGRITLTALSEGAENASGNQRWVRIDVAGEGEATQALRDRVGGFDFALRSSDADLLSWTVLDLTESVAG